MVNALVEMGFETNDAVRALTDHHNDMEMAMNQLLVG